MTIKLAEGVKAFLLRVYPWAVLTMSIVVFFWGWFALMDLFSKWLERAWK